MANWGSPAVHATDAQLQDWSRGCDSPRQSDSVAWTAVQSNEAAQSLHHHASLATLTASTCSFTPVLKIMALQASPHLCRTSKNLAWDYGTRKKHAGQLERGRLHQQSSLMIWLLSCRHWIGVEPVFRNQSSVKSSTFSPGLCPAQSSATTDLSIKPRVKFQKLCHFGGEERFVFIIVWTALFSALAAPRPTAFTFQQ